MKARTSAGASFDEPRQRDLAAEMLGQEGEELAGVAAIGLDRLRRHPPLAGEEGAPARSPPPPRRRRRREDSGLRLLIRPLRRFIWLDTSGIITPASYPFLKRGELRGIGAWHRRVVDVLVPVALDQAYSYVVPPGMEVAPGDVVAVPLGPREALGVVWAENDNPNPRLDNRLKDIADKLDVPPLKAELRKFVDWVSNYTLSPRGMVVRMALRMGEHLAPARERVGVRLAGPPPKRMTAARNRVLAVVRRRARAQQGRDRGGGRRHRGRHRRADRRGHAGNAGAAAGAGGARARSGFRAARIFAGAARRRRMPCARPSPTAAIRRRCSTASPAPARPRSISRRWRKPSAAAGRR